MKVVTITESDIPDHMLLPFLMYMKNTYKNMNIDKLLSDKSIELDSHVMEDGVMFKTTIALREYDN